MADNDNNVEWLGLSDAMRELVKHGAANFAFHGVIGWAVATALAFVDPLASALTIEIATFIDALLFGGLMGAVTGLLGMMLAIEKMDETDFNRFAVANFLKSLYTKSGADKSQFLGEKNGKRAVLSRRFGLCVAAKQNFKEYLLMYRVIN